MYYYNARYYDPDIGRFITADTIVPSLKDLQAFNRYTYVRNNPIKYTDPTGHSWFSSSVKKVTNAVRKERDKVVKSWREKRNRLAKRLLSKHHRKHFANVERGLAEITEKVKGGFVHIVEQEINIIKAGGDPIAEAGHEFLKERRKDAYNTAGDLIREYRNLGDELKKDYFTRGLLTSAESFYGAHIEAPIQRNKQGIADIAPYVATAVAYYYTGDGKTAASAGLTADRIASAWADGEDEQTIVGIVIEEGTKSILGDFFKGED